MVFVVVVWRLVDVVVSLFRQARVWAVLECCRLIEARVLLGGLCLELPVVFVVVWRLFDVVVSPFSQGVRLGRVGASPISSRPVRCGMGCAWSLGQRSS